MTLVALLSWIAIGAVFGAVVVSMWRTRDMALAWGIIVGGAGGSAGGLVGRMFFPESVLAAPFAGAVLGAVLALLIGGAESSKQRPSRV